MNVSLLDEHLQEVARWYPSLAAQLRESERPNAEEVATEIVRRVSAVQTALAGHHLRAAQQRMREIKGLLTKPGTGALLSLRAHPELEAEAGRLHATFELRYAELVAFNDTQPVDQEHLSALIAARREAARAAASGDGAQGAASAADLADPVAPAAPGQ